ncbi:unnamed protein product [Adineta steineri]|uniref:Uncharacterized protein n=1 Tax=Adineta steineri TaxID=433720 RepID=A0A813MYZ5_9BILA|nr:unnamed protein product [Adineta steineri]CAF0849330.1 unnamed protein product [Adineta steineri]
MEIIPKLIIIFVISTIYVQGEISPAKIKNDAAKMAEIYRKYMMNSPKNTIRGIFQARCFTIGLCCDKSKSQVFDIVDSHTLEDKCTNHPELMQSTYGKQCSDEKKSLDTIKKSSEYARFLKLHSGVPGSDQLIRNWRSQMKKACTADELTYYCCYPDAMYPFQLCQEKMLQSLANQNGGKNYDGFLHNWINDFTTFNERIAKEFPKST